MKTYSIWSKWGWRHIWEDIRRERNYRYLRHYIWEHSVLMPIWGWKCRRYGHVWNGDSRWDTCERCYADREKASLYSEDENKDV